MQGLDTPSPLAPAIAHGTVGRGEHPKSREMLLYLVFVWPDRRGGIDFRGMLHKYIVAHARMGHAKSYSIQNINPC